MGKPIPWCIGCISSALNRIRGIVKVHGFYLFKLWHGQLLNVYQRGNEFFYIRATAA